MAKDDAAIVTPTNVNQGSGLAGAVPDLGARTVVGVFRDTAAVERAYAEIRSLGVSDADVSVVHQGDAAAPPMGAGETRTGPGMAAGGVAGAVLGGIIGLAALAVPGAGPILAAGPIAAALSGAVAGGAMGALAGSFAGLGIPTEHAKEYEAAVRSGGTFISVKSSDSGMAERITGLLRQHGATKVSSYQPAL